LNSLVYLIITIRQRPALARLSTVTCVLFVIAITQATQETVSAQNMGVVARVASVRGRALLSGSARATFILSRGAVLSPGDEINTQGGGRVVIELSDGSEVIVQAGSRVVLKDYKTASTLRELFEITLGRVRVKINHYGGRPNPYRINSPSASIAVRGTEFTVAVEANGETRVVVYEGLVEVASVTNPFRRILVEPGRGVIVRPNEDIRFFTPGPGDRISERNSREGNDDQNRTNNQGIADNQNRGNNQKGDQNDSGGPVSGRDDDAVHGAVGAYERFIDSIVETGESPLISRFTAFPDSHLDSLENPSYATEFTSAEGRVFLLPTFGGTRGRESGEPNFGIRSPLPIDYGLSLQGSFFTPIPKLRAAVGGSFAVSHSGLQSFTLDESAALTGPIFTPDATGVRAATGSTTGTSSSYSLIAARQFGSEGHTSFGVGLDHLMGQGSLLNLTTLSDGSGLITRERLESRSHVNRTRVTLGLSQVFAGAQKIGLFYRYGILSADNRDRSHTLDGVLLPLDSTRSTGHSSEIGLRLRGPITHRLFYGVEGTALVANTDERTQRPGAANSNERAHTTRVTFSLGLGYVLRARTVFSFDVAGGVSRTNSLRRAEASGNILEDERQHNRFLSLHGAVQSDLWRRLFASASILFLAQSRLADTALFTDRFGILPANDSLIAPSGRIRIGSNNYFSNFGIGWRFTPNFLVEYILSTDYGHNPASHTLLIRYTFNLGKN
jgi:hypothetical protein